MRATAVRRPALTQAAVYQIDALVGEYGVEVLIGVDVLLGNVVLGFPMGCLGRSAGYDTC